MIATNGACAIDWRRGDSEDGEREGRVRMTVETHTGANGDGKVGGGSKLRVGGKERSLVRSTKSHRRERELPEASSANH